MKKITIVDSLYQYKLIKLSTSITTVLKITRIINSIDNFVIQTAVF